jgi:hypothetical protein
LELSYPLADISAANNNAQDFLKEVSISPSSFESPYLRSGPVTGDKVKIIHSEAADGATHDSSAKWFRLSGEQSVKLVKSKLSVARFSHIAEAYAITKNQKRLRKSVDKIQRYQKDPLFEFTKSQEEQEGNTAASVCEYYYKPEDYDKHFPRTVKEALAAYSHLSLSRKLAVAEGILQSLWESPSEKGIAAVHNFLKDCKQNFRETEQVANIPALVNGSSLTRSCVAKTSIMIEDITKVLGSRTKWLNDAIITGVFNALNGIYKATAFGFPSQLATKALIEPGKWDSWDELIHHDCMEKMIDGRFYQNMNLFKNKRLLFPLNQTASHWALLLVELDEERVTYYDSLTDARREQFTQFSSRQGRSKQNKDKWKMYQRILHYLEKRAKVESVGFLKENWQFRRWNPKAELQKDGCNCGVFLCCFAAHIMKTDDLANMPFTSQAGSIGRRNLIRFFMIFAELDPHMKSGS